MATPFDSLDDFIALPRIEALALSPDGRTVVLTVAALKKDTTGYERSLWSVPADGEAGQLWLLPAAGGEARPVTRLAGGVDAIAATAEASETVVVAASLLPGAESIEADASLRARRKEKKVSAILHETYPVRFWD